jgi:UDP-N-acetylmuramate dehydrogenase
MKKVSMAAIIKNQPLAKYNTFGIDVKASYFMTIPSAQEAVDFIKGELHSYKAYLFLGGGSNILFTRNFEGLVMHVAIKGIEVLEENDEECVVKAAAGEDWPAFVDYCVQRGWGGIENLALIPGQVGAAPVQNIGAYGREVKDVIETVEGLEIATGNFRRFSNKECAFGYRYSIFKNSLRNRYLITAVTFRLHKQPLFYLDYGSIRDQVQQHATEITFEAVAEAVKRIRRSKLPDVEQTGSAGSFFKNPILPETHFEQLRKRYPTMPFFKMESGIKVPAGWLIEQCGWRGYREGDCGVYPHQALVLVNYGGASGKALFKMSERIRNDVSDRFNINLQREVTVF